MTAGEKYIDRTESEMQATIEQYCALHGWPCYRQRTDRRATGKVGQPDLLICLPPGRFVAIECKMKGNKLSTEQERELAKIDAARGVAAVVYSSQEAIEMLKRCLITIREA